MSSSWRSCSRTRRSKPAVRDGSNAFSHLRFACSRRAASLRLGQNPPPLCGGWAFPLAPLHPRCSRRLKRIFAPTFRLLTTRGFAAARAKPAPALRRLGFSPRSAPSALFATAQTHFPLLGSNYVTALLKPTFLKRDAPSRCGSQASRPSPEVSGRWKR